MSELFNEIAEATRPEVNMPAIRADSMPVDMRGDPLVRMAIEKDLDADKLEKIIDLFNKQEDRRTREEFETVFAKMQAELPVIRKTTQGHGYMYASLESIQKACDPVIRKYEFSYRFREEAIPGQAGKRCFITISRHGYSIENWFDVPVMQGTAMMNPIQAAGAMSSYGKRYAFAAGFGITIEGEDTDGNFTLEEVKTAQPFIEQIKAAKSREQLQVSYAAALRANSNSKPVQKLIMLAKDEAKAALNV